MVYELCGRRIDLSWIELFLPSSGPSWIELSCESWTWSFGAAHRPPTKDGEGRNIGIHQQHTEIGHQQREMTTFFPMSIADVWLTSSQIAQDESVMPIGVSDFRQRSFGWKNWSIHKSSPQVQSTRTDKTLWVKSGREGNGMKTGLQNMAGQLRWVGGVARLGRMWIDPHNDDCFLLLSWSLV